MPVGEGSMPIRTFIVAAVASLSMTTMSLADWGTELTATGGADGNYFGQSVAIDGDTCVIGAAGTNSYTGSAYVYGSGTAATGACCVTNGCTVIAETACTELGGTWTESGVCDDCPASCAGDTNGDGVIDIYDLLNMLSGWGVCP